jgi:hypothetical protein
MLGTQEVIVSNIDVLDYVVFIVPFPRLAAVPGLHHGVVKCVIPLKVVPFSR